MKDKKRAKLPFGTRKFLRQEKARIRETVADPTEQNRLADELIKRYSK